MPEKQQLDNTVSFAAGIGCSTISGLPNSNNNNNEVAVKVAVRVSHNLILIVNSFKLKFY